MASHDVLFFGDDIVNPDSALRELHALAKLRPQLNQFLQAAASAFRRHLLGISIVERCLFDNIPDIVEPPGRNVYQATPSPGRSSVLLTVVQVGEFLVYVEDNLHILTTGTPRTSFVGLGVGLLAACTAAAARDTSEVVTIGVEAVLISLNVALELAHRASPIVHGGGAQWESAVVQMPHNRVQSCLDEHNQALAAPNQAYISVIGDTWVAVSGPPSTVETLRRLEPFRANISSPIKITHALHAPYLAHLDKEKIVFSSRILEGSWSSSSCFSTSQCIPFEAKSLREAFLFAVGDILQRPCRVGETVAKVASLVKEKGIDDFAVIRFGDFLLGKNVSQLVHNQLKEATRHQPHSSSDEALSFPKGIAAIGISGRFPGADSVDELWDLLQDGKDVHQEIPSTRFDLNEFYDPSGERKNSILTRYGCFLRRPGEFDSRFFNISPREAAQMDPLQRIFLMTTYEALEMAGYNPNSAAVDKSRIATYFGQSTDDWRTINEQQGIQAHYLPCTNRSFAPGRVNHHFQWGGGYYSIDTSCSSSATAIHLACAALRDRECDMSVVGGGNICVIPEYFSGFSHGNFLSPTGSCKTFSNSADGYCRGEAVATIVLKRLEDAVAANDNILGVITATARNTNAGEGSITYPGKAAQVKLLKAMLERSGTMPLEIGFVEMHGTGTEAGDSVELNTIRNVLARWPAQPLYVGAVKACIGHGEAAAGISSLVKALLMLQNNKIPPQPGRLSPGRQISELGAAGIYISDGKAPSIARSEVDGKRKIIVNSFDAAGGNTSMLLQDGPVQEERKMDPRTHHVVICTARTPQSLRWNIERLRRHLEGHSVNLADLSYTTTARRIHHPYTQIYVAESVQQLISLLEEPQLPEQLLPLPGQKPSLVFTFTGQGSQYTAMGATLYRTSPRFQRRLDAYNSLCASYGLTQFLDLIRGTMDTASATPAQVQLSIIALEIALAEFLRELGLTPTLVMGHSLGEYSALCVAGVLSVIDTLYLVHERAVLMEKYCTVGTYGMMTVPLSAERTRELMKKTESPCEICCLNGPDSTVVGGQSDMLNSFEVTLANMRLKPARLRVPFAPHSSQMDPILADFGKIASNIHFGLPRIPVVSTVTKNIVASRGIFGAAYLVQQVRQPVDFIGALNTCHAAGLIRDSSTVVEIGPRPVCISLVTLCLPNLQLITLPTLKPNHSDWEIISNSLAVIHARYRSVNWEVFHDDYRSCLSLVKLPSYAFDLADYWTPYKTQAPVLSSLGNSTQAAGAYFSTGVQRLEYLSTDEQTASFVSRIAEPSILEAIQGHVVSDAAICPASLFIDMACAAASALLTRTAPSRSLEILSLNMTQPLVVSKTDPEQTIRVKANTVNANSGSVNVQTSSASLNASSEHATCQVRFHDESRPSISIWPQVQSLVQRRVESLCNSSNDGSCHKMARGLMYKLFDTVVEYSPSYRVLDNVIIDKSFQDAVAELHISKTTTQGSFSLDLFALDALVHLPGFLLNCNLEKPKDDIHIAKSIGRAVILESFRTHTRPLTCYATITEQTDEGTTLCDVYAFKGGDLAAFLSPILFQKMSKSVFNLLIESSGADHRPMHTHMSPSDTISSQNTTPQSLNGGETLYSILLRTVAAKTGIDIKDVMSASCFAELGVDSHMGISIIAQFNRETRMILPAAFFNNFPTLLEAEKELREEESSMIKEHHTPASEMSSPSASLDSARDIVGNNNSPNDQPMNCVQEEAVLLDAEETSKRHSSMTNGLNESQPKGRAILLQGSSKSQKTPLFLVAESSGSVAVYTHFLPLPDGRRLYGLESPFLQCPQENTLSIPEMARAHITTMRSVQPTGPYLLGGYSFASVYAYEMAYQLALEGERLLGLVLIDMYVPPPAHIGLQRFSLDGIGTGPLANVTMRISQMFPRFSDNQKAHMGASMRSAAFYTPTPIPANRAPYQTHIIWAAKGVNENSNPAEHDDSLHGPAWMGVCDKPWEDLTSTEMATLLKSWFFAPRETFGTNGWERLVPQDIHLHRVDADHLSIVAPPRVQELGKALAEVVESCTQGNAARIFGRLELVI